jgi:hypothetical protein
MKFCSNSWLDSQILYSFKEGEFPNYNQGFSDAFAQIQTNGNYLATILLGYADCNVPVLTTYTYDGNIIDSKDIFIGDTDDVGYSSLTSTTINKDFTIYVSDSIVVWKIDSLNREIAGTREEYVNYINGKMLENGKIELSKEQRKYIKQNENSTSTPCSP